MSFSQKSFSQKNKERLEQLSRIEEVTLKAAQFAAKRDADRAAYESAQRQLEAELLLAKAQAAASLEWESLVEGYVSMGMGRQEVDALVHGMKNANFSVDKADGMLSEILTEYVKRKDREEKKQAVIPKPPGYGIWA